MRVGQVEKPRLRADAELKIVLRSVVKPTYAHGDMRKCPGPLVPRRLV
jgi:hypothetical protein